jgi:hypothetical protein
MDNQRLRNLTTGYLHTDIDYVYQDLELIIGFAGMTHMLPRMHKAIQPWLREHVKEQRFWDFQYDPNHTGETELPTPTEDDRKLMTDLYFKEPDLLEGKKVIVVEV